MDVYEICYFFGLLIGFLCGILGYLCFEIILSLYDKCKE